MNIETGSKNNSVSENNFRIRFFASDAVNPLDKLVVNEISYDIKAGLQVILNKGDHYRIISKDINSKRIFSRKRLFMIPKFLLDKDTSVKKSGIEQSIKSISSVFLSGYINILFLVLLGSMTIVVVARYIFYVGFLWLEEIPLIAGFFISTIGMICAFKDNKLLAGKDLINYSDSKSIVELLTKSVHLAVLFVMSYIFVESAYTSFVIRDLSSNEPGSLLNGKLYMFNATMAFSLITMAIILILSGYNNWIYRLLTVIIACLLIILGKHLLNLHNNLVFFNQLKIPVIISTLILGILFWKNGISFSFILCLLGLIFMAFSPNPELIFSLGNRGYGIATNQTLLAIPMILLQGIIIKNTSIIKSFFSVFNALFNYIPYGNTLSIMFSSLILGIGGDIGLANSELNSVINSSNNPVVTDIINLSSKIGSLIFGIYPIIAANFCSIAYDQAKLSMGIFNQETISVKDILFAGIFPLLFIILCIFGYMVLFKNNLLNNIPKSTGKFFSKGLIYLFLVISNFGLILLGIATPTEAYGLSTFIILIYSIITKDIKINKISSMTYKTASLMGYITLFILASTFFGHVFTSLDIRDLLTKYILDDKLNNYNILLIGLLIISLTSIPEAIGVGSGFFNYLTVLVIIIPVISLIIFERGIGPIERGIGPIWVSVLINISYNLGKIGFSKNNINDYGFKALLLVIIGLLIKFPEITTWLPLVST